MVKYTVEFFGPKGWEVAGNAGDHNPDYLESMELWREIQRGGMDARISTLGITEETVIPQSLRVLDTLINPGS